MRRVHRFGSAVLLLLSAMGAEAASLKVSCSGLGQELDLCRSAAAAWASKTGNEVEVVSTPNDGTERLALYQQVLSARSDKIDVFQIDVVWPGLLSTHLLDLRPHAKGAEKAHFEGIVANNTVAGKLVAMPWFTNAGQLFYRSDLLDKHGEKVPVTWEALKATAEKIQAAERSAGNDKMWGFVWQGRAYEGLSCNALEWVASHKGGTVVEADGKVSINNPRTTVALQTAASWVGTISPKAVLNYGEEEARGVFQAGNAVFMRNWPYAWALGQGDDSPVKGKIGVAVLPKGGADGRHAATLGGESLAVSKYSKHPALAADLVMYMTSAAVQKERALKASYNPTIGALYKDADIAAANPFMTELYGTFTSAVARPATVTGARYNQVSNEFWNAAHDTLSGRAQAPAALKKLDAALKRFGRGGRWQ